MVERSSPRTDISPQPPRFALAGRWTSLIVLIVGVALFESVRRVLIHTDNPNLLPTLILLGAAIVPAAFLTFISERRLSFDVKGGMVAVLALVGGVVGVATAGLLEFDTLHKLGNLPMAGVGVIEESSKLIGPLVLLMLVGHRRPATGLLVGVASGAGFATLETMGYAFVELIKSRGNLSAVDGILLLRGVLSPAAHMAWTGLTAAALWQAVGRRSARAFLHFFAVFVAAVALHTAWDSLGVTPAYGVIAGVSLGLLAYTTHALGRAADRPEGVRGREDMGPLGAGRALSTQT